MPARVAAKPARVLHVRHSTFDTPFGRVVLAATDRGVCSLHLLTRGTEAEALAELGRQFPAAELAEDSEGLAEWVDGVKGWTEGDFTQEIPLDLYGTPFQRAVWAATREVGVGETISYTELAKRAGYPGAVRAAGSACANNPVWLLVPCHRIVRRDGGLGGYGGGLGVKERLLAWEQEVISE